MPILAVLNAAFLTVAAVLPQPVQLADGALQGVSSTDGAVAIFKGIPFAAPPAGDLRWKAPQPPAPWPGVRHAVRFGPSCMQRIVEERKPWTYEFMAHNEVSEDCLHLNIWTGAKSASERRPVFVWIHGGGYTEGSTAVPVYDGENLAKRGVVVVTINYRLGVFGYLAHPELSAENPQRASGNYGMLDQIAALRWVQKNIAKFGGDPSRVTVGGQSAGAGSVHNLVASPLAKGLFHRAIAQSGSSLVPNARVATLSEAEQAGVVFATAAGAGSLRELRQRPAAELLATRMPPGSSAGFRPIVDGWAIPMPPREVFAAGRQNDVPTLTGLTADEASSQPDYGRVPADKWREQVKTRFAALADSILRFYSGDSDSQKELSRDLGMVSMALWAGERAKTAGTKAYTYFWTRAEPGPDSARFGAFHTSEVPYVFETLDKSDRGWTDTDRRIARTVGSYWVNFMATGDPNGAGLPRWPAFDAAAQTMELGERCGVRPLPDEARRSLLRDYLLRPGAIARYKVRVTAVADGRFGRCNPRSLRPCRRSS